MAKWSSEYKKRHKKKKHTQKFYFQNLFSFEVGDDFLKITANDPKKRYFALKNPYRIIFDFIEIQCFCQKNSTSTHHISNP